MANAAKESTLAQVQQTTTPRASKTTVALHQALLADEDGLKAVKEGVRGSQILILFSLGGDVAAIEDLVKMGVDVNTKDVST